MSEGGYKIRVRRGDFELEVQGDKEFVLTRYTEIVTSVAAGKETIVPPSTTSSRQTSTLEIPQTIGDKLARLKDDGFFSEPKDSGRVTRELRDKGWGVFVSKDISSALKRYGPKIGLRRVALGKGRYAYTHP